MRMHTEAKVVGKGRAHVGKMDAILTDSHLDTRIKRCILMNVVAPKLAYAGEVREGNHGVGKTAGNSTDDSG